MGKKGVRGNIGADVDAVIRESDLIEFDGSFGQLAKLLKGSQKNIEDYMNALSSYAPKIRQNFSDIFSFDASKLPDSDKLRLAAQLIDQIYNAELKLAASRTETAKTLALVNEAISKNTQANKLWAQQMAAADGSINQMNASVKQLKDEWFALSEAEREGAQGQAIVKKIVSQTTSINKLNAAIRNEINTQMKLDSVTRQRNAAMSTEMKQVSTVRQELNALNRQRELEMRAANAAAGSYDKLAAMYELGKLKLKGMAHETQEQINVFEAYSQELAKIYKQMMDMQEATGKHTLSVGDYGKAFRSLSTETGMLVRELPSLAVSANTFFLAISNNLPMFMSAVSRMKKENQALAAQGMATTSVFKTVMKSILSWQTLVIVALSLLSKYGSKVIDWIKSIFTHTQKAVKEFINMRLAIDDVNNAAMKATSKQEAELSILVKKLKECTEGSETYKTILAQIADITHTTTDDLAKQPDLIEEVTKKYLEQQRQLAINQRVVDKIAEAAENNYNRQQGLSYIYNLDDKSNDAQIKDRLRTYGVDDDKLDDAVEKVKQYRELGREMLELTSDFEDQNLFQQLRTMMKLSKGLFGGASPFSNEDGILLEKYFEEELFMPKLTEQEVRDAYEPLYKAMLPPTTKGNGTRTYTNQFEFDPWYEAKKSAEALAEKGATEAETIELWEKKKLAIELATYSELRDKRRKYWDDQQKKLEADLNHGLITEQQYAEWDKAIERQRQLDIEALERKHNQDMLNIQQEAVDKRTKLFLKHYEVDAAKLEEQLKGITDPEKAKQILNELNMMVSEIETARDAEGQSAESAEAYRKALEELQKQIASTTSAITKMNIEQVKADTHLQKFGRAASALGQKRNLTIASKNIDELSAAIKKLREQMAGLDPKATNFETDKAAIQKQIDAYISQMQTNLNRVDVSKLTSSDGDLITRMIESSIDAAQPEQLLSSLRNLGFGDVVNMYLAEAIGETNDPALVRAFTNALQDNNGDIEAAIASMEPGMQEKMREVLANVGMKAGDDLANVFKKAWDTTKQWFNQTIGYLKDLAQAYVDLAEAKAEAAAEATDAAQEEYDKEKALLEAGYANQVETKWAEYQEKKRIQEEAEADAKAAAARMEEIETAQQMMSLVTSIANIFEVMTKLGPWGTAAAAAMSDVMLALFIAAKSKAKEAAAVQYGEGHAELIGGGTHASGHDSPLAYDNQGRERRVERGEVVGIFKSRAVREIGASRLIRNIDNINRGRYTELATKAIDRGSNLNMLAQSVETSHADLSKLESGVNKIARQGEKRTYVDSVGNIIVETPYGKTTYAKR